MQSVKILFCLLLAAVMLIGCGGAADDASSLPAKPQSDVTDSGNSSSESAPTSSVTSSQTALVPDVERDNAYGDLLLQMAEHGQTLVAYGELENAKYADALAKLETVLDGYSRNVSVVAYSLDGRRALGYNTEEEIFCACAVKAPYTLYCLMQMERGAATLDTQMTYKQEHYEPGTGDMQYSAFGTVFDMRTILGKSMSISDNVGYLMSVDYFGRDGYNEWITSLGCPSLMIKPTVWSLRAKARDLALAWREIYKYFREGGEYAEFLYDSCTGTAGNYSTQSLSGVSYSHKQGHNRSGDWKSYTDAGIVWKEGDPYILVILTDAPGPSDYDADVFAHIAQIVHVELF